MAVIASIHGMFILPAMLHEAGKMIERDIDRHADAGIHTGAVPRIEFETVMRSIDHRLERIEKKIDEQQ